MKIILSPLCLLFYAKITIYTSSTPIRLYTDDDFSLKNRENLVKNTWKITNRFVGILQRLCSFETLNMNIVNCRTVACLFQFITSAHELRSWLPSCIRNLCHLFRKFVHLSRLEILVLIHLSYNSYVLYGCNKIMQQR